jgi:hypothetical protein
MKSVREKWYQRRIRCEQVVQYIHAAMEECVQEWAMVGVGIIWAE